MTTQRTLTTRRGPITFPTYIPVTTFGKKYPIDDLIRPYLPRLAQSIMVSYYYAHQMAGEQRLPVWVDSGGFASLFKNSKVVERAGLGVIEIVREEKTEGIRPIDVLDLQERVADVAFTLDFPIPPNMDSEEAKQRQQLTINNAYWALQNRRRRDLPLYACLQAWDVASARECARAYKGVGFNGVAIGGLVPRARNVTEVLAIVESVRKEIDDLPLHVLGLGKPNIVEKLFEVGVDSVDSSSYVKLAADGKLWTHPDLKLEHSSPTDLLHLAICNLATATRMTLPLSVIKTVFLTHQLVSRIG